jgi:redox-sensitive bicupin YhaK (pirin superfamily)
MQTKHFPAAGRSVKDIGWLQSRFLFSFSDFYDPSLSAFGTLVAFNDDTVAAGKGFGIHPHQNMEIVSIMLQGSMNHIDTLGYKNVVHEDSVQIMSAGSGLRHEEYNVGDSDVGFLQIWIQPKLQNLNPRYQFRQFPKENRRNKLQTIVSSEEGPAHCWINQNTKLSLGLFDAGSTVEYTYNPVNKCLFVFCIDGSIRIGEETAQKRDGLGIWGTDCISINCSEAAHFLVIETPVNQK